MSLTPVHVRARKTALEPAVREHLDRRMARQFGKFALHIERMTVRFRDLNGPRGGKDKRCELKLVLSGLPSVIVRQQHASPQAAMDGALRRVEYAVRRSVQRRRAGTRQTNEP